RIAEYDNDPQHFSHVLEYLFVPAMRAAGFEPWLPRASGAELVHAEFSRALCLAEMVLVDLSSLNPNVFFELGIRTARDGPVSLVCDDKTETVPFDVGVLNYCQYSSALRVWELEKDLANLTDHLLVSASRAAGHNMFWQRFGSAARKPRQVAA